MNYADPATPRHQLPLEELPRGFVPWPDRVLETLEQQQEQKGFRFGEDYATRSLTLNTLAYYYDGLHVAYRPAAGGLEVLAVGWRDAVHYLDDPTVKVVQA